jgi:hypothetical protein
MSEIYIFKFQLHEIASDFSGDASKLLSKVVPDFLKSFRFELCQLLPQSFCTNFCINSLETTFECPENQSTAEVGKRSNKSGLFAFLQASPQFLGTLFINLLERIFHEENCHSLLLCRGSRDHRSR